MATDGDTYGLGIAESDAYPRGAPDTEAVAPGIDLSGARRRILAYVRSAFPGLDPEPVGEVLRLTTSLEGGEEDRFALWRDGPVAAFAGGNLFKFAPVLGARLAGALLEGGEVWPGDHSPGSPPPSFPSSSCGSMPNFASSPESRSGST
jgi:hypothetical protein